MGFKKSWRQKMSLWNGAVGNTQQQLPFHVVNQYCHPVFHDNFHPLS